MLPVVHTSDLIGRVADLARVTTLVEGDACRLLTLVGPGGVGKTRLALAAAERLAPGFADGAAYVPLAGVEPDDPDGVADLLAVTVAEALAVPLAARRPVRELLQAYLADRHLLVVLDNLEQLGGIGPLLTDLLAGALGVKLLATSRRRVGAGVEWVFDVPGLAYPPEGADAAADRYPAVELFCDRARRVRAGFSLAADGPAVAAICRLVEGLPLAIELAADLSRTLPCQVIADKLGSDLTVLQTSSATVPRRHRSMRAVFEASWRLLDGNEQRALARLSVFRGGFDPAAAEAVAGATLPVVSALVERSLVSRGDGGRYGLHELLRQFAEERLEAAGDAPATRRAHAGHYAGFLRARRDRLADALDQEAWPRSTPRPATCGPPGRNWPRRRRSTPWPSSWRTCGGCTDGTAASRRRWHAPARPGPARRLRPAAEPLAPVVRAGPVPAGAVGGGPGGAAGHAGAGRPAPPGDSPRVGPRPWPGARAARPAATPWASGRARRQRGRHRRRLRRHGRRGQGHGPAPPGRLVRPPGRPRRRHRDRRHGPRLHAPGPGRRPHHRRRLGGRRGLPGPGHDRLRPDGPAADSFGKVVASSRDRHDTLSLQWGLTGKAETLLRRSGDAGPAVATEAAGVLRGFAVTCPVAAARSLRVDGLRQWQAGRRPRAVRAWRRSLDAARRLDLPYDEAMAHLQLGRHLRPTEATVRVGPW